VEAPGVDPPGTLHTRTATAMDQLILAAHDVVEAWENHTLDLEETILRLGEVLKARTADLPQDTTETPELTPATIG
jgi:hypothetical protein